MFNMRLSLSGLRRAETKAVDHFTKHLNLIKPRFEVVIHRNVGNDQTLVAAQHLNSLEIKTGAHLNNIMCIPFILLLENIDDDNVAFFKVRRNK